MQVKVCPKCKAENKPENVTCSGCYASLDGVQATESQGPAATPAQPPTPSGPPPPAQAPPQQRPPAAQGPPPEQASPYGPPPAGAYGPRVRPAPEPVKQGSSVGVIILLLLVLGGGAFAGWWFFLKPPTPEQVVQNMLDAAKAGDFEGIKACFTQASVRELQRTPDGEKKAAEAIKRAFGQDDTDSGVKIGKAVYEGDNRAFVSIEPPEGKEPAGFNIRMKFELVLLREDGRWKIDEQETEQRMMEQMQKMFPNMPRMPGGAR